MRHGRAINARLEVIQQGTRTPVTRATGDFPISNAARSRAAATAVRRAAPQRRRLKTRQSAELLEQRLGVGYLELAPGLDVQLLDHAVVEQHRVALRAQAH